MATTTIVGDITANVIGRFEDPDEELQDYIENEIEKLIDAECYWQSWIELTVFDRAKKWLILREYGHEVSAFAAKKVYRNFTGYPVRVPKTLERLHKAKGLPELFIELYSQARIIVADLIFKDEYYKPKALKKYARKRLTKWHSEECPVLEKKEHKCEEKDRYFTRHSLDESFSLDEYTNPVQRHVRNRRETYTIKNGEYLHERCCTDREHDFVDDYCQGLTFDEIRRKHRCRKQEVCKFFAELHKRDPDWRHRRPTKANPNVVRSAIQPRDVSDLIACCRDPKDYRIVELWRSGQSILDIALELNRPAWWVEGRLQHVATLFAEI